MTLTIPLYLNIVIYSIKGECTHLLLRNLYPSDGLSNGTGMICKDFHKDVVHAEITNEHYAIKCVFLPRIQLSPHEIEGCPFKFIRKQFPVHLYFAMTMNKMQGQTILTVGLDLLQHIFFHGQLYATLPRGDIDVHNQSSGSNRATKISRWHIHDEHRQQRSFRHMTYLSTIIQNINSLQIVQL